MNNQIEYLFRVMDSKGITHGAAFLVAPRIAITCHHVIANISTGMSETIYLRQEIDGVLYECRVEKADPTQDIALLALQKTPNHSIPFTFSTSHKSNGAKFHSFGYPDGRNEPGIIGHGIVDGIVKGQDGIDRLQLNTDVITTGFSGAPIVEDETGLVVGMTKEIHRVDKNGRLGTVAFAIPSEVIRTVCPHLIYEHNAIFDLHDRLSIYVTEIIDNYTSYWQRFVKKTPDVSQKSHSQRPVGQAFILSDPKNKNIPPKSNTSPTQIQDSSSENSFSRISNKLVFPSLLSAFNTLVLEHRKRFLILAAEPGAGKTFSLRSLAAELAQQFTSLDDILPIFIPLYFYSDQDDLLGYICNCLFTQENEPGHHKLSACLEDVISQGRALFLFDGLNEIESALAQQNALDSIYKLSNNSNNVCIVSTRVISQNLPEFTSILSIRPLDRAGAMECIQLYAPQHLGEIIHLLEISPRVRLLASNPFRLKIVCELFKPDATIAEISKDSFLPENPGKLLEKYILELEERWLNIPSHSGQFINGRQNWQAFLGKLASKNAPALRLEDSTLSADDRESLLFADSIGVIQWINAQVIFIHQQLQEYFASIWLKTEIEGTSDFNTIQELMTQAGWDESFYLLAGILDDRYIDQLTYKISQVDPFLAARCVGVTSQRLSPTLLDWFADYLRQGLQHTNNEEGDTLFEKTLIALGDAGYEKCFENLIQAEVWQPIEAGRSFKNGSAELYYQTVARYDIPRSAEFIIERINENLATPSENYGQKSSYEVYTLALARMHTPIARQFLSEHLQDIRIYQDVVKAVGLARWPETEQMQDLLFGTGLMNYSDSKNAFLVVTQAIGEAGLTELIPTLKLFKNREEAIEVLLKFDTGQELIDDYVVQQEKFLRLFNSSKDFIPFSPYSDLFGYGIQALRNWCLLINTFGRSAADIYTDLLIHCVQNSTKRLAVKQAIIGLVLLRVNRALPILKELIKRRPLFVEDSNKSENDYKAENDFLSYIIQSAIEFLETPEAWGIYQDKVGSFMLLSRAYWKTFKGQSIQRDPLWHLEKTRIDRSFISELAVFTLYDKEFKKFWVKDEYLDLAARALIDLDQPNIVRILMQRMMSAYQHYDMDMEQTWRAGDLLVLCASKGNVQRQAVISELMPLLYGSDENLQIVAIEILADLTATEECLVLFEFLNDHTWVTAYAVVGAISRLQPDKAAIEFLLKRLNSRNGDERYFAALALGESGETDFVPHLLKLENDPNPHVRRAMLCALARCGSKDPDVVRVVSHACKASNGWERLEAARVAGELRLTELIPLLIHQLEDYDMRVVEQAVIALGQLKANSSLPSLHLLFQNLDKNFTDYWQYQKSPRPEQSLQEKIAISIAQFTRDGFYQGANLPWQFMAQVNDSHDAIRETEGEQSRPEHQVVQGLKKNDLLQSVITGQIQKGSLKPWGEEIREAFKPKIPMSLSEESTMKDIDKLELNNLRRNSPNSVLRLQAFRAYAQEVDYNDLRYDYSNLDPNPKVQFELRRLQMERDPGNCAYAFTNLINYDLALAQSQMNETPDLVNFISYNAFSSPFAQGKDTTLLLAKLFPQDYNLKELVNILLQQVEAGNRDNSVMSTLSSLLEYDKLHRVIHSIRQTGFSYTDFWFDAMNPLVQRHVWQIVPELLRKTRRNDSKYSDMDALDRLCCLGVYQAADLLDDIENHGYPSFKSTMIYIELAGLTERTSKSIPQSWYEKLIDSDRSEAADWYLVANIACEADAKIPPKEWLYPMAKYLQEPYRDEDWLGRGLRKWGMVGVATLFSELTRIANPEKLEKLCWSLLSTSDRHKNYDELRPSDRESILKTFSESPDPEEEYIRLLDSPQWGVRLLGTCLFLQQKNTIPEHLAEKIIFDSHPSLLKTLLKFGLTDDLHLPALSLILDQNKLLLKQAIKNQLDNLDTASRKDLIGFLGVPDYRVFAFELLDLIDDPDLTVKAAAINSIRRMGAMEYKHQISKKRKTRQVDILIAVLETSMVFDNRIAPVEALKLLKHKDNNVVRVAAAICGLQGIQSSVSILQNLLSRYQQEQDEAAPSDSPYPWNKSPQKNLQDTLETLHLALFMLGIEPGLLLGGLNCSLGEGLTLLAAQEALLSFGNTDNFFMSNDLPYPFILDGEVQLALIKRLIELDLEKASWAEPILIQGIVELLTILDRCVSTKERITTFLGLPFDDEAIVSWHNILDDAQSSLHQQIKSRLKALDPSQSWVDLIIALRTNDQENIQFKEKPEELVRAIICYATASSIIKDEEISHIFLERLDQTEITARQKGFLTYIIYLIMSEDSEKIRDGIIEFSETYFELNKDKTQKMFESDFMQTARTTLRLCITQSVLNEFSDLTIAMLQAAIPTSGINQNWLEQYQKENKYRKWFDLFYSSKEITQPNSALLNKINPFSSLLATLNPPEGLL